MEALTGKVERPMATRPTTLLAVFLIACASGCASFQDRKLTRHGVHELASGGALAVDYDLAATLDYNGGGKGPVDASSYKDRLDALVNRSGVFGRFSQGNGAPVHLSFRFDDESGDGGTAILCGLTLFLFPAILHEGWTMTVDVRREGQLLKTYRYQDSCTTYMELFMIFVMPFEWIMTAYTETCENMVVSFLYDLQQDRLLEGQAPGAAPSAGEPARAADAPPPPPPPTPTGTCSYCGQAVPPGATECPHCGATLKR
jgi:hypothetical protein